MKSYLAFYRLSIPAIRSMATAPSTVEVRRRILDDPPSARGNTCPTLVELAAKLNIDMPSLSDEEWTTIRKKMASSLMNTLTEETKKGILMQFFDADTGLPTLDWPDDIRNAWTHKEWWGDNDARLPPPPEGSDATAAAASSSSDTESCRRVRDRHDGSPSSSSITAPASPRSVPSPSSPSPQLQSRLEPPPFSPSSYSPLQLDAIVIAAARRLYQATSHHLSSIIAEGDALQATLSTLPSLVLGPHSQNRRSALCTLLAADLFIEELLPLPQTPHLTETRPLPGLLAMFRDLKMTRRMARISRDGAARDLYAALEDASSCDMVGEKTKIWALMGLGAGFSGLRS
ncbi:hypothetical protein CSUB01_11622 [Colletotrichum sublineola]|uniref:Uncharacterized protein n=1 Tax=Colletotrichum sublineola TaxID=1173701 RepID=A0A066WTF9_COLSU|nr:hypothetical protein CSUB01_11622 [Colletotrichum sublineola]